MGYLSIDNLYKNQEILNLKECYAMEKIHGTSANVSYSNDTIHFFSSGEKHETFIALFNKEELKTKIESLGVEKITIYGEAYGGKQQGMRKTYGDQLKFVAYEVKIGQVFLSVPQAEKIVKDIGLEFVHYEKVKTDIDILNQLASAPSVQAKRNGIQEDKLREGVVLRTLIEVTKNNGERIIAKHKNDFFSETKTKRTIDEKQLKVLSDAKEVAEEWVTEMRLTHVLDKFPNVNIEETGQIIKTMLKDVEKESKGEIEWSKSTKTAIGKRTSWLFKQRLKEKLYEVQR